MVKGGSAFAGAAAGAAIGGRSGNPYGAAVGGVAGGLLGGLGYDLPTGGGEVIKDYLQMYKDWERREIMRRAFGLPRIR